MSNNNQSVNSKDINYAKNIVILEGKLFADAMDKGITFQKEKGLKTCRISLCMENLHKTEKEQRGEGSYAKVVSKDYANVNIWGTPEQMEQLKGQLLGTNKVVNVVFLGKYSDRKNEKDGKYYQELTGNLIARKGGDPYWLERAIKDIQFLMNGMERKDNANDAERKYSNDAPTPVQHDAPVQGGEDLPF